MTIDAAERARVLVEALPYIKRFHGQKIVIKLGGSAMEKKEETLLDIVLLRYVGLYPVLVHMNVLNRFSSGHKVAVSELYRPVFSLNYRRIVILAVHLRPGISLQVPAPFPGSSFIVRDRGNQ